METKKWYQKSLWINVLLIFFFPVGLYLVWKKSNWKKVYKVIATALTLIFIFPIWVGAMFGDSTETTQNNEVKQEAQQEQGNIQSASIGETSPTSTPEPTNQPAQVENIQGDLVLVTRIIDGDTIEIQGGQRVRYIGIDTPEITQDECFSSQATNKNKELVGNKKVRLVKDVSETDRYARLLRYVYTEDGKFVNDILVKEGYANASSYPPDVKYQDLFRKSQQEAASANLGLWGGCNTTSSVNATSTPTTSSQASNSGGSCNIKGNVSSDGEKIYHVPGCQSYSKTVISEGSGERWFCSEQEALQAGWRKALNCP